MASSLDLKIILRCNWNAQSYGLSIIGQFTKITLNMTGSLSSTMLPCAGLLVYKWRKNDGRLEIFQKRQAIKFYWTLSTLKKKKNENKNKNNNETKQQKNKTKKKKKRKNMQLIGPTKEKALFSQESWCFPKRIQTNPREENNPLVWLPSRSPKNKKQKTNNDNNKIYKSQTLYSERYTIIEMYPAQYSDVAIIMWPRNDQWERAFDPLKLQLCGISIWCRPYWCPRKIKCF